MEFNEAEMRKTRGKKHKKSVLWKDQQDWQPLRKTDQEQKERNLI